MLGNLVFLSRIEHLHEASNDTDIFNNAFLRAIFLSFILQVQAPDASEMVRPEPLDADDAPAATFVDTVEALEAMVYDILGDSADKGDDSSDDEMESKGSGAGRTCCTEIAVDLEHHSFR